MLEDKAGYEVAPDMRCLRRPKQTVHPARRRSIRETKVNQKPKKEHLVRIQRGLMVNQFTWAWFSVGLDVRKFIDLMFEVCEKGNVDCKRD